MTATPGHPPAPPQLIPCLMIGRGRVMLPGEDGPVVARDESGQPYDILDVTDRLAADYPRVYVVDLDGIDKEQPQLDYLQEISRAVEIWVDSGIRTADQAIDTIVAGANRAVLSTAYLESPRELRRAWKLSTSIAGGIEIRRGRVVAPSHDWADSDPRSVAAQVREIGIPDVILGFREETPDWTVIGEISVGGPTWVEGTFEPAAASRLASANSAGGIFHIRELLLNPSPEAR